LHTSTKGVLEINLKLKKFRNFDSEILVKFYQPLHFWLEPIEGVTSQTKLINEHVAAF